MSIIDKGIARQDTPHVLWMGALLVLLGVVGLASSLTAQYFAAKSGSRIFDRVEISFV